MCKRKGDTRPKQRRSFLARLNTFKNSEKFIQQVRHLAQRKLLSKADSRSTVERNIIPTNSQILPPFWAKLLCVLAVYVLVSM